MPDKADRFLKEASALAKEEYWDGMTSRAYYAIYTRIRDFLTNVQSLSHETYCKDKDEIPIGRWSHKGLIAAARSGKLGSDIVGRLQSARSMRVKADYFPDEISMGEADETFEKCQYVSCWGKQ